MGLMEAAGLSPADTWGFSLISVIVEVNEGGNVKIEVSGKYYRVLWGDGTDDGRRKHVYKEAGEYRILILGRRIKMLDVGYNRVKDIDLCFCCTLKELRCDNNNLKELDLSLCSNLEVLKCGFNQITCLKLPERKVLIDLDCNHNQLECVDLNGFNQLTKINFSYNLINEVHLQGCTKLKIILAFNNLLGSGAFLQIYKDLSPLTGGKCGFFLVHHNPGYRQSFCRIFMKKGWFFTLG